MSDRDGKQVEGGRQKAALCRVAAAWIELRDERGKLRAKWDPRGRVLEIGARGEVARWRVDAGGGVSLEKPGNA